MVLKMLFYFHRQEVHHSTRMKYFFHTGILVEGGSPAETYTQVGRLQHRLCVHHWQVYIVARCRKCVLKMDKLQRYETDMKQ